MEKTYEKMKEFESFNERFKYLKLEKQAVGESTFGPNRYLNQRFYKSSKWHTVKNHIIERDGANDLGDPDHPIYGIVYIHHINPLNENDIRNNTSRLYDPNNLICVSKDTHNALHYGDETYLNNFNNTIDRSPNDMAPWKRKE